MRALDGVTLVVETREPWISPPGLDIVGEKLVIGERTEELGLEDEKFQNSKQTFY